MACATAMTRRARATTGASTMRSSNGTRLRRSRARRRRRRSGAGRGDLVGRRAEDLVDDRDLIGMDRRLAAKAERARARASSPQSSGAARSTNTASMASAPIVAAASTTCDRARSSSSPSSVRGMPSWAVRSSAPKISAGIVGTGAGDRRGAEDAARGFDHRNHAAPTARVRDALDVRGRLHLRQHDGLDVAGHRLQPGQVVVDPRRSGRVDAHEARRARPDVVAATPPTARRASALRPHPRCLRGRSGPRRRRRRAPFETGPHGCRERRRGNEEGDTRTLSSILAGGPRRSAVARYRRAR